VTVARAIRLGLSVSSVAVLVLLTGCGSSGDATEQDVATSLTRAVDHDSGGRLTAVKCVKRDDRVYRCVGKFRMSQAGVEASMKDIDTTGFTDADWRVLVDQNSGPVSYEVTVDQDGESYIYEAQ
jgi:hypothetical protein